MLRVLSVATASCEPDIELGHADVALTLRVYSHVLPRMQKNAADGLDEMLF